MIERPVAEGRSADWQVASAVPRCDQDRGTGRAGTEPAGILRRTRIVGDCERDGEKETVEVLRLNGEASALCRRSWTIT